MKPATAIAIVIVVVLLILGVIFWQLGLFESKPTETPPIEPTAELITPTQPADITPITSTEALYPPAVEPAETTYTIKSGDSLWEIAKQCYGDGSKWKLIYDANKDKVPDQNRLKVGTVLTIPPEGAAHPGAEVTTPGTDNMGREGQYYIVQKNDNLWNIAKKFYKSGAKADLIFNANRDKLATKNSTLKIGWRLFSPKEGGSAPNPNTPPPSDSGQPQDNVPMGTGE
jgi:5'-nucleotidase